jgi:hypothetical protein
MRVARPILALVGLLTLGACGEELDRVTLLKGYRLIALESPTPTAAPTGELVVSAVDHDTEGRPVRYTYTLCPFSFGSASVYACLVPETELTLPESDDPTLRLNLGQAAFGPYTGLTAALTPAVEELTRQLRRFDPDAPPLTTDLLLAAGVDLWVKVESGPPDARQRSVRAIKVRLPQAQRCLIGAQLAGIDRASIVCAQDLPAGRERDAAAARARADEARYLVTAQCCSPDNTSPELLDFTIEGVDDQGRAVAGRPYTMKVTPGPDARQHYWLDDRTIRCPNSDRDVDVRGGPCREEIYFRWYASGGEIKPGVSFESDAFTNRETRWTAPAEPGPVQLFVVAFDGRGGVRALPRVVEVVAAP